MNPYATQKRKLVLSSFILMMMLASIALKAVVPAGFMPESKNGFVEIVICSGMGEKTVLVPDGDTPPAEHKDKTSSKDICAYQILASGKLLVPAPVAAIPLPVLETHVFVRPAQDSAVSAIHLPFEARGPPSA